LALKLLYRQPAARQGLGAQSELGCLSGGEFCSEDETLSSQYFREEFWDSPLPLLEIGSLSEWVLEYRDRARRPAAMTACGSSKRPELARCEFLQRRENVLLLGNSGTGKTHLALAPPSRAFHNSRCPSAGGIGIRALRGSRLQGIGTSHAQMRQRSRPAVPDDPAVVENSLELSGSSTALPGC
jgi:hypothetical protein